MPAEAKTRQALVLSHIAFEDLGSFETTLRTRGFEIESLLAAAAADLLPKAQSCDLLVIMGGPMGVYEQDQHPFLANEIAAIRQRIASRKPTLGVCLGAQLMAAALGARVYPGTNGKEIGWSAIQPVQAIPAWFAPLVADGLQLLHWHGDTFDIPAGALHLASSNLYANQAFAIGNFALALQFHPEVTAEGLESWYTGHADELTRAGISVQALRSAAQQNAPTLAQAAASFLNQWLDTALVPRP